METITTAQATYLTSLIDGLANPAGVTADLLRAEITATLKRTDDYRTTAQAVKKGLSFLMEDGKMVKGADGKVIRVRTAEGQAAHDKMVAMDTEIAAQVETILAGRVARYQELKALDVQSLSKGEASALISELKN